MSTEPRFDVWLHRLTGTASEPADQALSRVFGIPLEAARAIVTALPSAVRRDADAGLAQRIATALEAIGGAPELRAIGPLNTEAHGSDSNTAATLTLGTQDLHTLLPSRQPALSSPHSAPPSPPRAPASGGNDAVLELAVQPSLGSQPTAEARRRAPARVSLRAPELFGAAGPPASGGLVVEWQHPLQLPPESAAPTALAPMRLPSARTRLARRRTHSPPTPTREKPERAARLEPTAGVRSLFLDAAQGSWSSALRDRPSLGFVLVLGGITSGFLVLIAAL